MERREIVRKSTIRGLAAVLAAGSLACGDESPTVVPPPETGDVEVTVATTGFLKDDSYILMVDGESQGSIAANDQRTLTNLDVGLVEVSLADVAENCTTEAGSVTVTGGGTVTVTLNVACAHETPAAYSELRASRDRPDLETGTIVQCTFGLCDSNDTWDLYVEFSGSEPQAMIRQNTINALEIALLTGVSFAELSEADYTGATFTTEFVEEPLGPSDVVLLRTDQGNVYAVGNPLINTGFTNTLTFDAALIATGGS